MAGSKVSIAALYRSNTWWSTKEAMSLFQEYKC